MMSLPSISRMTDRREADLKALKNSKTMTCDCCMEKFPTKAEGRYVEECWSPLIADKPSSILTICPQCATKNAEEHGNEFGEEGQESGYFQCRRCDKLQVYNYSWEIYATWDEAEGYICQSCAAERELGPKSDKWLDSEEAIIAATKDVEALKEYGPKHLSCIGGTKTYPCGAMSFRDTPEYKAENLDWYSKMEMGGWGDTNGLAQVQQCALEAFKHYGKVYITIGEAGQFQIYMDILVDTSSRRAQKPAKKARKTATVKA